MKIAPGNLNLTNDEKIVNCLTALWRWHNVPKRRVDLDSWEDKKPGCGTTHCFGGWVATWPEFQALGIKALDDGAPIWRNGPCGLGYVSSWNIGAYLFGARDAFEPSYCAKADTHLNASDYDLVVNRLETAIEELSGSARKNYKLWTESL